MLDFSNLPKKSDELTQYFTGTGTTAGTVSWQVWNKPLGIAMVYIVCIGSGAGGGNPPAAGTSGYGGGGSAGMSRLLIPAFFVPNTLYMSIPGPTPSGSAGLLCYVSTVRGSVTSSTLLLRSGNAVPGAVSGTTGGTAGSVSTTANAVFANAGITAFRAGLAGGAGATANNNAAALANWITNTPIGAGSGGGGDTAGLGGNITNSGTIFPTIPGGAVGTVGQTLKPWTPDCQYPFVQAGGTGGGGTGGNGSNAGGYGAGGGGGGGYSVSGSTGGMGGPGFVMITCW